MASYRQAVALKPDDPGAHNNLGLILARQDQLDEAAASYQHALRLTPDDPEMWRSLAKAHGENEDWAAAIECCERVMTLAPDNPLSYSDFGWAYQEEGRLDEAAAGKLPLPDLDLTAGGGSLTSTMLLPQVNLPSSASLTAVLLQPKRTANARNTKRAPLWADDLQGGLMHLAAPEWRLAAEWLAKQLADGPRVARWLIEAAREHGWTERHLEHARRRLGVTTRKAEKGWEWRFG